VEFVEKSIKPTTKIVPRAILSENTPWLDEEADMTDPNYGRQRWNDYLERRRNSIRKGVGGK